MGQLGYEMTLDQFGRRMALLGADVTVVASEGDVCHGLMVLHRAAMLQVGHSVARIMTLVVDEASRGRGVGRLLTGYAERWARAAGCDVLELTTNLRRTEAHAFYEAAGFTKGAYRFHMPL
jgi:GNAT superfamily N-acetyltransferase